MGVIVSRNGSTIYANEEYIAELDLFSDEDPGYARDCDSEGVYDKGEDDETTGYSKHKNDDCSPSYEAKNVDPDFLIRHLQDLYTSQEVESEDDCSTPNIESSAADNEDRTSRKRRKKSLMNEAFKKLRLILPSDENNAAPSAELDILMAAINRIKELGELARERENRSAESSFERETLPSEQHLHRSRFFNSLEGRSSFRQSRLQAQNDSEESLFDDFATLVDDIYAALVDDVFVDH